MASAPQLVRCCFLDLYLASRNVLGHLKCDNFIFHHSSTLDLAEEAPDAVVDLIVGWGEGYPIPIPSTPYN